MNTVTNIDVTHGLTLSKIRSVSGMIRGDNNVQRNTISQHTADEATPDELYINLIDATVVRLSRQTGGNYDANANYDGTSLDIDNAAAVDKGSGLVGIPITGHTFDVGNKTTLAGTVNYDATYTVISQTANEIVITATFVAETFVGGGAETASWSRGWITIGYTE